MKPLRNINETAQLLGISPWTVRLYVRNGKLRAVRIGTRVLLEENELERFVTEAKANASSPVSQQKEAD